MELESGNSKWRGSVRAIVEAPIDQVWTMVSQTKRLPEWVPMIETCTDLAGEEGQVGYVRLVSGFMFPQEDGERSWIKEKLISMDSSSYSYEYQMESSNVGLDGSVNNLRLVDYGNRSTLVVWSFEIEPLLGASQDYIIDFLGYVYKSSIGRIGSAIQAVEGNSLK
ncbi:Lachrymatory-factor synthase [Linum perenne]